MKGASVGLVQVIVGLLEGTFGLSDYRAFLLFLFLLARS